MFKPMLAPGNDPLSYPNYFKELQYPLLCSPKYDGIRCIVKNSVCYSRTMKPLPSFQVQDEFNYLEHFDGELVEGDPTDATGYNRTQSHVMSEDKPGDIAFYVFDYTPPNLVKEPYWKRLEALYEQFKKLCPGDPRVVLVQHTEVETYDQLVGYEYDRLQRGYEGIMMRSPIAPYKYGRGTWREGYIYKLKRFEQDEGEIIGFEEQMTNENVLETNELGYAKRSYSKSGLTPANTLGNFLVLFNGDTIQVAPGAFTHAERKEIWDNKLKYLYSTLTFRYFKHGVKDKPRFPRAVGFRDKRDL